MQTTSTPSMDSFSKRTWLHYFNNYLLEQGTITKEKWRKMRDLIG